MGIGLTAADVDVVYGNAREHVCDAHDEHVLEVDGHEGVFCACCCVAHALVLVVVEGVRAEAEPYLFVAAVTDVHHGMGRIEAELSVLCFELTSSVSEVEEEGVVGARVLTGNEDVEADVARDEDELVDVGEVCAPDQGVAV